MLLRLLPQLRSRLSVPPPICHCTLHLRCSSSFAAVPRYPATTTVIATRRTPYLRSMSSQSSSGGGSDSEAAWSKLSAMIRSTKFCMLATTQPDGLIRSRPMATQSTDYDKQGELWFFTQRHSHKVDEMKQHPDVNLAFAAQSETLFISVSGKAELVMDKQKMTDMWNPVLKVHAHSTHTASTQHAAHTQHSSTGAV